MSQTSQESVFRSLEQVGENHEEPQTTLQEALKSLKETVKNLGER